MSCTEPLRPWQLLAIPGSLRRASINRSLLEAAQMLAAPASSLTLYTELGELPLFNPDLELPAPVVVARLEAQVRAADALVFACPEYAHGIPGAFKNALDWLVGGEGFVHKPVVLLNAAPRAHHAQAALAEVVKTMSGRLVPEACRAIPLPGWPISTAEILAEASYADPLRESLEALVRLLERDRSPGSG
jgi:chromate reductase, NAD(P)H dehydrogenase (quinone)